MKPGDSVELDPPADIKVTNVSLGFEVADLKGRTSLRLVYGAPKVPEEEDELSEDEAELPPIEPVGTILCSLTPGAVCLCIPRLIYTVTGFSRRLNRPL